MLLIHESGKKSYAWLGQDLDLEMELDNDTAQVRLCEI